MQKKIVYTAPATSRFPSRDANSIHMMRMCESFASLGHEVTLFVPYRGATENEIFKSYGISPSFAIRQVPVPSFKGKSVAYALSSLMGFLKIKPNLVVGRSVQNCMLGALFGLPTVFDSHNPVWQQGRLESFSFAVLRHLKSLKRMTTNSDSLKRLYEKEDIVPRCGIRVANNGSPIFSLDERPDSWPGRKDALQIGYTGHLYPGRGIEMIVACAERMPDMDFHIIGGTEKDIAFWRGEAQIGNLFFHGFVKHSVVHKYRNSCDVLLAPYQAKGVAAGPMGGDQSVYMNPIKLIEYLSSGKPIVCSDIPVLREIVQNEKSALLCPSEDVAAWCDALVRLKGDPTLRKKLGQTGYEEFLASYTWQKRAQKMIEGI